MNRRDAAEPLESLLLDLHLNKLDRGEADSVEDAVARSPELATQSRALRDLLNLLDRYEVADPPEQLADKVLARVCDRPAVLPFPEPASELPSGTTHELPGSPVLSLRELIAIAACITLFIGVFVPGYYKARSAAARNLCRANYAQLYGAMSNYAQASAGALPFAGYVPDGFWHPVRVPNVLRASNTRHFFLLLRERNVREPRVFLCPADSEARPMLADNDDYAQFNDFAERANNSYSFLFMNCEEPPRLELLQREGSARMALAGDRNPLFDGRTVHRLNPYEEETFNSPTHDDGAGQNVLYADGHAAWTTNPLVGVDRDNIYRSGQRVRYLGNEQPSSSTDSFLP